MLVDICYYRADRKAVGAKKGDIAGVRTAGSPWSYKERRGRGAIFKNVELSSDELRDIQDNRKYVSRGGGRGIADSLENKPSSEWKSSQVEEVL